MRTGSFGHVLVLMSLVMMGWRIFDSCEAAGTIGFDLHHLSSDRIKELLAVDWLPDKDSLDYYRLMVRRDRRRLNTNSDQLPLTFAEGNETRRVDGLGFLHYVNLTVGTPPRWFLVALDTGSDLFWLPCDCGVNCVRELDNGRGTRLALNVYSPDASSTSSKVTCNNSLCQFKDRCSSSLSDCPYQVRYLSQGTSTTGVLVEDVLHLGREDVTSENIEARVTLGCGQVQTGDFLTSAAVNGLFGLGLGKIAVPSILADSKITSNSFSMCFGFDRTGRITLGDKGSSDQQETPIIPRKRHLTYNIGITHFVIDEKVIAVNFTTIFDTGTSFTYMTEPQYTLLTDAFHSQVKDKRSQPDPNLPFDYCYELRVDATNLTIPTVNLTMIGGAQYSVIAPIIAFRFGTGYVYCLTVIKEDFDIIGQNFMTGYNIVFDGEKMALGWKLSDCNSDRLTTEAPVATAALPPHEPPVSFPAAGPDLSPRATTTSGGTSSPHNSASRHTSLVILTIIVSYLLGCISNS